MATLSDWIDISSVAVAIIGIIVGCIGGKELKISNEIKTSIKSLETKIDKLDIKDSQIATTITNTNTNIGLDMADTENIAHRIVDERTQGFKKITYSNTEPESVEKDEIVCVYEDCEK